MTIVEEIEMVDEKKTGGTVLHKKEDPPANDKKDEAKAMNDEKDNAVAKAASDRQMRLLEKAVEAIGVLDTKNKALEGQIAKLISELEGMKTTAKAVPPKMDTVSEGGKEHDPVHQEDDQTKNLVAPEASVPKVDAYTATAGAFVKKADLDELVAKAVEARVKAVTPAPIQHASVPDGQGDLFTFMRKAVAEDRAICGGAYQAGSGDGFGLRSGAGNPSAREATARFFTKAYGIKGGLF